jgi:hypothetical protein
MVVSESMYLEQCAPEDSKWRLVWSGDEWSGWVVFHRADRFTPWTQEAYCETKLEAIRYVQKVREKQVVEYYE